MALSPQDIQAFWAAAPQSAQPQSSGGIGGFLARNAGTIGSIALPGIADILTGGLALPADVALSAIGGAGGQAISNAAQHKSLTNDLLGQALSGGAGAVGGRLLGSAGGLLSKAVTTPIDKGVARAAQDKVAQENLGKIMPFIGADVKNNDLAGAFNALEQHGINTTPENVVSQMHNAADLVTGTPGAINGTKQQILADSGPVDISGAMDAAKNALARETGLVGETAQKGSPGNGILSSIRRTIQSNAYGNEGTLTGKADPNKVLDTIQALQDRVRELGGTKGATPGAAEARAVQKTIGSLKSALSAADKNVAAFTLAPADEAAIRARATEQGMPQLGEHVINTINNAKTVQQLQSAEAPFVNVSQVANAADQFAKNGGFIRDAQIAAKQAAPGNPYSGMGTMYEAGAAAHGNPFAAFMLVNKASRNPVVIDKLGNALSKVRAVNGAFASKTAEGAIKPGAATIGKETARIAGQVMNHPQNNSATASAPTTSLTDALSSAQPSTQPTTAPDTSPFSAANIQRAIAADMAMTGGKNVSQLLALYNTFGKPQDTLTTNQKNEVVSQQKALESLQAYAQQLDAAGGAEGPLLGALNGSILGNYTNPAAKGIDAQRIDVASAIAGALNPRGTVSPVTARIIADALPSIHDTPDVARTKISNLIAQIQAGAFSATTPVSDLTSALGGA